MEKRANYNQHMPKDPLCTFSDKTRMNGSEIQGAAAVSRVHGILGDIF